MYPDKKNITLSLSLILILSVDVFSQVPEFLSDSVKYVWPTNAGRSLSSTFAETRSAHFHAGIDIKTWGQEGYKVFATRDGVIHRIGISPNGYGKVVYMKHADGSYSVYAHLNRFEPALQAYADSVRLARDAYIVNDYIEHLDYRFKAGEVIAYTGSTGIGPPHLHFELRTPDYEPFNPLLTNLSVDDTIPPVFAGLAVEEYTVEDGNLLDLKTYRPRRGNNLFDFGTIHINNPAGLAVDVYDKKNNTLNAYAVYELSLIVNADTIFHSKVNYFDYLNASQMFIDRSYPLLFEKRKGFQRLFVVNGNELPFYRNNTDRGILYLDEGVHNVKIIAKDFYGNTSEALVRVNSGYKKSAGKLKGIKAYPYPAKEKKLTDFTLTGRVVEPRFFALASGQSGFETHESSAPGTIYLSTNRSHSLLPGRHYILHTPDQTAWIDIPSDAFFDTLDINVQYEIVNGLPEISFYPSDIPLKNDVTLKIVKPHKTENEVKQMGIFFENSQRRRLDYTGSRNGGNLISTSINRLGKFVVRSDSLPPEIGQRYVRKNLGGQPALYVHILDKDTGINLDLTVLKVNGEKGIIEYEPDKNRILYYKPGMSLKGDLNVELKLADYAGNYINESFTISN